MHMCYKVHFEMDPFKWTNAQFLLTVICKIIDRVIRESNYFYSDKQALSQHHKKYQLTDNNNNNKKERKKYTFFLNPNFKQKGWIITTGFFSNAYTGTFLALIREK